MKLLTAAQLRAVRWYIGDVDGNDPFWGDPKAYVTLNSLFFPGMETEQARVREGKCLNPAILADETRLRNALQDLVGAFRPLSAPLETCRVERYSDFERMRECGHTLSFTSTSTAGFLPAYQDRNGIALMRFTLPAGVPCLPMAQALPHYAKADEAEVLLPPGMRLTLTELLLSPEETQIIDAQGEPPQISVLAEPAGFVCPGTPAYMPFSGTGVRVLTALNAGKAPEENDRLCYQQWKQTLVAWVGQILRATCQNK